MDRRELYPTHDLINLAIFREYSQRHSRVRYQHPRLRLFPPLLASFFACDLVSCSQDQTSVYSQGLRGPYCRNRVLHLGYRASKGHWTYCQAAKYFSWFEASLGYGHWYHVCHFEFRNPYCGMYFPFPAYSSWLTLPRMILISPVLHASPRMRSGPNSLPSLAVLV